jgi:hypothetical protein
MPSCSGWWSYWFKRFPAHAFNSRGLLTGSEALQFAQQIEECANVALKGKTDV